MDFLKVMHLIFIFFFAILDFCSIQIVLHLELHSLNNYESKEFIPILSLIAYYAVIFLKQNNPLIYLILLFVEQFL